MSAVYSAILYLGVFFLTIHNIKKVVVKTTYPKLYSELSGRRYNKTLLCRVIWILIASIPFILVYGLRFQVGADYRSYLSYFNYMRNGGEISLFGEFEPGYVILNMIAARVFHQGYGIFLIVGMLMILILYRLAQQFEKDASITLLYYIFFMVYFGVSCNVVRQMIAVTICAGAYHYILDRKFKLFILCILAAALFHKSALFCASLYFLGYIRSSAGAIVFKFSCCLMGLLCILFQDQVLSFMTFTKLYSGHVIASGIGIRGVSFLLYVIPALILIELTKNGLLHKKPEYQFFVLLMWMQIPIQCCGLYNQVLERMSLYCSVAQVVLVPAIVKCIKDSLNRRIWEYVFKAWYLFHFIVMEIYLPGNGINGYQIWY